MSSRANDGGGVSQIGQENNRSQAAGISAGSTATHWTIAGHMLVVLTFLAAVGAWTAWTDETRAPLASVAGLAQLGSMLCYTLGHRQRVRTGADSVQVHLVTVAMDETSDGADIVVAET